MTPGARLSAAIDILNTVLGQRQAADVTCVQWARANRFAGSGDRRAIETRVYAALRRRNEAALRMDADDPRSLVLGTLALEGESADAIAHLCTDGQHAPGPLTFQERRALARALEAVDAPWHRLNYPEWLHGELERGLGNGLEAEMRLALTRAPADLRANTLKTYRAELVRLLEHEGVVAGQLPGLIDALRVVEARSVKPAKTEAFRAGLFEVQDFGSQLVSDLCAAKPDERVVDLCAGAGGKTLALAAMMQNRGRLIACDIDARRLGQLAPRAIRAGATIVEMAGDPYTEHASLAGGTADLVVVDAPCSGSGTWRRNPETKWTLDPLRLESCRVAQAGALDRAAALVKPGGRLAYIVCSYLPAEGRDQVAAFLKRHPVFGPDQPEDGSPAALQLSIARDGTDGFFAQRLVRRV